ncbi:MAG: amidohydrolase [Chloroflexota bacterium]
MGRIATLAGTRGSGWAGALSIDAGRIRATGDARTILRTAGPRTVVTRLDPALVLLPGLCDAHLHLADAALAASRLDLSGCRGREATLHAIAAAHAARLAAGDADGWLLGAGWSLDRLGGRPSAADLDAVAPGRPVALWSHDHHARWVSGSALGRAGIGADTADPPGGVIGRAADGTPDGFLLEDAAVLVDPAIPAPDDATLRAAIVAYARTLARLGVTAVHDPGDLAADPDLVRGAAVYRRMAEEDALPLRVAGCIREDQLAAGIAAGFRTGRPFGSRYHDGWLKLFADGALGSRSAALLAPYASGDPAGPAAGGPRGMLLRTPAALAAVAGHAAGAGIAVTIHAIGDAAVRHALDVLAALPRVGGASHRIEHAQLVAVSDRTRFGRDGITASMQPGHLITDAGPARHAWGARLARAFPLRGIAAAGGLLAFGTDAPVEPADPWPGIAIAVSRTAGTADAPDRVPGVGQRIGRADALRAATRGGPASLGLPYDGMLVAGAPADLIAVPADALTGDAGPDGPLARCRPVATLIAGAAAAGCADLPDA